MRVEWAYGEGRWTKTGGNLPWHQVNEHIPGHIHHNIELTFNGGPLDAPDLIARGGIEVCDIADRKVAFASERRQ